MSLSTALSYEKMLASTPMLWYNRTMSRQNTAEKILELLQKYGSLRLSDIEKKLNNYSNYVYQTLRQLVQTKTIYCVNNEIYVWGNPDDLLEHGTVASGTLPEWYKPDLYYVPLTRTDLVNHIITTKPDLPNISHEAFLKGQALYVWYCLAHPKLDTSYLTAKEYDVAEAESQFNQLVQDITQD